MTTSSREAGSRGATACGRTSSSPWRPSFVTNAIPLSASRSAVTASCAPGVRSSPTTDAAVEVEQDVVVAGQGGGDGHGRERHYPGARVPIDPRRSSSAPRSASLAAGCGGSGGRRRRERLDRHRDRGPAGRRRHGRREAPGGLHARPGPGPARRRGAPEAADGPPLLGHATVEMQTNCGAFTITLAVDHAPKHRVVVRHPRQARLLRRPHVPSHLGRPGERPVRHPGRRPARHRARRSRLLGPREAARGPEVHEVHGRDGQDPERAGGHVGQPVLHRDRGGRRAAARLRARRQGHGRPGHRRPHREGAGERRRAADRPGRDLEGDAQRRVAQSGS